ncbi:MAG: hypothetical protein RSG52_13680 [Terrisporobacter sp.]|uniref:hypothetical protein n=1 Tax=Terrisporobacter sp. TaxID=1965305 RepID=UPI002FCAD385
MKRKLSTTVLIISVIGMMIMGISLGIVNKTKVQLEDLEGNRDGMGDMSFLLQARKGSYETDEILINKDSEKIKRKAKEGYYIGNLTKENIENRDLLEYVSFENNIFESDNEIGSIYASNGFYDDKTNETVVKVTLKNKENNKITEYEMVVEEGLYKSPYDRYVAVPIKIEKDFLHVAILYSQYDDEDKPSGPTMLNLYKLNLTNETSQKILSKEYEPNDVNIKGDFENFAFSKDNKVYFLVNKSNEKDKQQSPSLLEFDIISKDIEFINLDKMDHIINKYYLEGDEVLLLPSEDSISTSINAVLVNLKDKKVEYKQNLDLDYDGSDLSIIQARRYNNKIYMVTSEYVYDNYKQKNNCYITVFDEKTSEKLYRGKLKFNTSASVNAGIVKDDEI